MADTDSASVADLNSFNAVTSGVITATVLETDVSTLLTLTSTSNAYTMTVDDATVTAANLISLDAKTTVKIDASLVGEITGAGTDIAKALSSLGITHAVDVAVIVSAGTAAATDLNTIDFQTSATIDATAVSTISGLLVDINTDINSAGIHFSGTYNVNLTDVGSALGTLGISTSGSLTVGSNDNGNFSFDLGTSGFTQIFLNGSGNDSVTASSTLLNQTFILGAAQDGGTTLNGLTVGDAVNIDGASAISAMTINELNAVDVVAAGEWNFDSTSHQLTYFNDVAGAAEIITLTGVNTVTLVVGDVFNIAS